MRGKTLACFLLQVHNQHNISRRRHLQCMYIYFPGSWAGTKCSAFWTFMVWKKQVICYVIPRFFRTTNLSCCIRIQGYRLVCISWKSLKDKSTFVLDIVAISDSSCWNVWFIWFQFSSPGIVLFWFDLIQYIPERNKKGWTCILCHGIAI